ncbi:DUF6807 domain-containing protein [Sphingobacterium hotanense]|uniref:DUF6807 domain-containing protein n=1 Tax=Sphingobacterium hotanense TaxID=649196 RepID=UPI0021A8310D|nr:PmoA family protein [Sphingobacterium hotanense]MCT1525743.1 PmoA family protein [Sphingobacterium hotanense]
MKNILNILLILCVILSSCAPSKSLHIGNTKAERFSIIELPADQRIDILLDGKRYTSYMYADSLKKPILFPLTTTNGNFVTRGWPIEPRANERTDHPHQMGLWFNYGDVNGLDFWNNSTSRAPNERMKYGAIVHQKVDSIAAINNSASLRVSKLWLSPTSEPLLREECTYRFQVSKEGQIRISIRVSLNALQDVTFDDNKEGLLAIRVARELEQPYMQKTTFTNANGIEDSVARVDNQGVTGIYYSSEGKVGDDVFGTRGRWAMLNGVINKEDVSLVILDHPQNVGYPSYWFARGYGLFAANPLGQKVFSKGKEELNYKLAKGESTVFKYQVVIHSRGHLNPKAVDQLSRDFANQ